MFLLYINDIYNSSDKLSSYLFADDTYLLFADKNLRSPETVVHEELRNIGNWLMVNKLSLNVKKSNFVLFRLYQKRIDYEENIKIFDYSANSLVSLERKECVRYLGVLIDSNLSWKHHITYISAKITKSLGIFARLRYFVPSNTLSYDPYGPARAFIAKQLRKSPYEGRTRWREQGRKKPSGPVRIAYGPARIT